MDDADIEHGELHVSIKHGLWTPKNHAERMIPMNERLAKLLADWLVVRPQPCRNPEHEHYDWLFPSPRAHGMPFTPAAIGERATRLFTRSGVKNARHSLHQCRRTWATAFLQVADVETVRKTGGWGSLKVMELYLSTTDDKARAGIDKMQF